MASDTCQNPKCGKPVRMQIRKGSGSCSLDCDRAMGIGKYAEQAGPYPHPNNVTINQTIINVEKSKRGKK